MFRFKRISFIVMLSAVLFINGCSRTNDEAKDEEATKDAEQTAHEEPNITPVEELNPDDTNTDAIQNGTFDWSDIDNIVLAKN